MKHSKIIHLLFITFCVLPLLSLNAQKYYYYIQAQNGQYMTVLSNRQDNGTPIILSNYKGDASQKWEMIYDIKTGAAYLKTSSGKSLDIQWNGSNNGTPIQLWDFNGNPAQCWQFEIIGRKVSSTFDCYIQSTSGLRTIDFCTNGKQLYIWSYNASNCQKWKMIPTTPLTKSKRVRFDD
jgi:hypothetical protein